MQVLIPYEWRVAAQGTLTAFRWGRPNNTAPTTCPAACSPKLFPNDELQSRPDLADRIDWPLRTRTTPMTMQITAGQNVKKNNRPGPIGLGFGSGHSPTAAATMMNKSGPPPMHSNARPALIQPDRR